MTLHEAIETVIKKYGRPMRAAEIAHVLNNEMKLYVKLDCTDIKSSQIGARVKNYPQWFTKNGSLIGLYHGSLNASGPKIKTAKPSSDGSKNSIKVENPVLAGKILLNAKNFRSAAIFDNLVPNMPGIYAFRIKNIDALPYSFSAILKEREHNLIYIGIASQSLYKRMLGQELRAKGHGTFFRSLGALLGFLPPKGTLVGKSNTRNYTFSSADENKIISWINSNLLINWICMDDGWESFETELILANKPLVNIAKNPYSSTALSALRAKCVEIANS